MAGNDNSQRDPEEIRREIQATRQRMSVTMDALEERLNPQRLKEEAADKIREQTVGRVERFTDNASETVKGAGANVFETIKENPLPAALAAIGLGWLLMESRNQNRMPSGQRYSEAGRQSRYERYHPYGYTATGAGVYGQGGMQGRAQQMAGQAQGKVQHVAGQAQQVAGQAQDTVQQVAGQVQDTAQQVAGQVQDTAQQVAGQAQVMVGQAQEQVSQFGSRFQEVFDDNPLLIGAAALALGAAIGLSLPSTAKEDELMGDVRDNLMDTAQDKAQQTMQKVQQVASRAGEAAKQAAQDEAQKQNLPTGS